MYNDHFDIQNFLFDILRFKVLSPQGVLVRVAPTFSLMISLGYWSKIKSVMYGLVSISCASVDVGVSP